MEAETVLAIIGVAVAGILFAYWYAAFNAWRPNNGALASDVCYVLDSPNSTSISRDYLLEVIISNGQIISATPIGSPCPKYLRNTDERILAGPILVSQPMDIRGRARLTLTKVNGYVRVEWGG